MSHPEERFDPSQSNWLSLEVYVQADNRELLNGLEQWLQLKLVSEAQVKKLCRQYLSCTIPEAAATSDLTQAETAIATSEATLVKTVVAAKAEPNIITQVWLRFLDELSIRWLLFLGIFLVVVSSGVLAASQWSNFPEFGQYLILFVYTLGFWGFGFWSSKQENLKLTSQTLSAIATLLIPINFWAISHFRLGNNIFEWIVIVLAFVVLTATIYWRSRLATTAKRLSFLGLFLLLSYLHLGWQLPNFPLVAVYAGIMAISIFHYRFLLPRRQYPWISLLYLFAAWGLLLARGLINSVNTDSFINYNLAIALFAWLLGTIDLTQAKSKNRQQTTTTQFVSYIWQFLSIIILLGAWLLSVFSGVVSANIFFWQTVGVSFLALHLFSQRLTLDWRKRDLTAIFVIGLQTLYVSKELIPDFVRSQALDLAVSVSKTEYLPESVLGVTLFPYVILFVSIASWLYRRQKPQLALHGELLTLALGIGLTCLSSFNPTWRSLNLLLTTLTLAYVVSIRQPVRKPLIYLTHFLGLVAIISCIDLLLPNLTQPIWGSILILLMATEWGIYVRYLQRSRTRNVLKFHLRQSLWYAGLLLASLSYTCFINQFNYAVTPAAWRWGLVWLVASAMATLIAKHTHSIRQRRLGVSLSCIGLIAAQLLVLGQPETRFIALSVAIALMFVNAFNFRRLAVTAIHIGLGLGLIASLLYSPIGTNFVSDWYWLPAGGITVLCLYRLRRRLKEAVEKPKYNYISERTAFGILGVGAETRNFKLIAKYIQAIDYWAIAIMAIEVAIVSIIYLNFLNLKSFTLLLPYLLTTAILAWAIAWRYSEKPNHWALYIQAWLWGLCAVALVSLGIRSSFSFAVTNVSLGLLSLFIVAWLRQKDSPWASLDLSYVPLIYTASAIFWRLADFNAYTGLLTLGVAFVCLNTRQSDRRTDTTVNYLGIASISWGVYELIIYQMQQASGGSAADGLTILALVAAAIAFSYRLAVWWYRQHQQTTILNLNLAQFTLIAHVHWAISSILKIIAAGIAIETATPNLTIVSVVTSFCLGAYALIQGRDLDDAAPDRGNDWWVYVGLVEIAATLVYSRLIFSKLSLFDPWRVVFTCAVALLIYQIPWRNFGWRATAWQRTALAIPALMALVTAEDISYFSLGITAVFYLRIAFYQRNLRWSYVSLGFINWGIVRLVWQYNTEFIWLAGIISLSILYIAQLDPYFQSHRRQRHCMRLAGSSFLCLVALFYQDWGIIPSVIGFCLIFLGLGLRVRAYLFIGTITLILTAIYQLIVLVLTYSFLKWIVGLVAGICSIAIAAGFERKRDRINDRLQDYGNKFKNWQ